ncbi:hypothetical protein C7999DRAFT_34223 [Corynascus novoguineensis]|uniref:Uncharacterized protein n=1 Tax=Corynascus novoguineensis TaxID=1126955 RepID=A0AAN7CNK7_9PEZI|nr:hypothetical protein C7999DRAFT_34223 [Corynascus novoguineensis]
MAALTKPLDSPLPSLPPKLSGPPLKSIPRRPVAAPVTSTPTLAPTPSPAATSPNPLPSPGGSISSLLSAYSNHTSDEPLSASENPPNDTLNPQSTYSFVSPNSNVQKSSAQYEAPTRDLPSLPFDQKAQMQEVRSWVTGGENREELPPPPPSKDPQRTLPRPQTPPDLQLQATQASTSVTAGSPLGRGSPQQGELWRRRSIKADKTLAVPDLKLVSSHGSTAASVQNTSQSRQNSQPFPLPPQSKLEALEPAATQRAPPRSVNGGLPGRNIRPALSEGSASQGGRGMGQKVSQLKENPENGKSGRSGEEGLDGQQTRAPATVSPATSVAVSPVSAARLPTPDYGANDVKSPLPDTAVSPMSPASSPGVAGEPKPITRKAIGATEAQLRHAKSSQSLAPGSTGTGLGVRSPIGLPTCPRPDVGQGQEQTQYPASSAVDKSDVSNQVQPLPLSPAPDRDQTPSQKQYIPYSPPADRKNDSIPAQLPAPYPQADETQWSLPAAPSLGSSTSTSTPPTAQQHSGPEKQIRDPIHPRTISEAGSVETVKPRQQYQPPPVLVHPTPTVNLTSTSDGDEPLPLREADPDEADHTDHPGAALFPRGWYKPLPADAIPDPRPLTERHYSCLTQHRYMTANRQRTNPVACRTCGHKDRNAECYICSACHLNVCSGCTAIIRRCKGDLTAVLKEVERGRSRVSHGSEGVAGGSIADGEVRPW